MMKVLLVDDERIILEGISTMIDWGSYDAELVGTSRNGIEALERIEQLRPDIVISDIKMPGLDGLQLVERSKGIYPELKFILLSGFDEFEYAQRAMHFGVKHYLLKPCNENVIIGALQELIQEIKSNQKREQFMAHMQSELAKALPHAKEQFLKELVTNKTYGQRDWEQFRRLFSITEEPSAVQLVLCEIDRNFQYEHLFAVKNIAEDVLGHSIVLLGTTIGSQVLLLLRANESNEWLFSKLSLIRETFQHFYKLDLTIAASDTAAINQVRKLYHEAQQSLSYRFYLGEGTIITKNDVANVIAKSPSYYYDDEKLSMYVRSGDWSLAKQELTRFFQELGECRLDSAMSKSYVLSLLVSMTRLSQQEQSIDLAHHMVKLEELQSLKAIEQYMISIAEEITSEHLQVQQKKHSTIVERVISIVEEHLTVSSLSLNWVANDLLYMNPDYLGKLFKKETGEKFSNYVMRLRIEKALSIIEASSDVKIFELAEQLGFGDNPQYFSQVFKKVTGQTPTEYRNAPGL